MPCRDCHPARASGQGYLQCDTHLRASAPLTESSSEGRKKCVALPCKRLSLELDVCTMEESMGVGLLVT
eukprot:1443352-Amphidinium_carterae.1